MNQLTKAQITIGLLACFSMTVAFFYNLTTATLLYVIIKVIVIFVLSYIILALLEWVKVFDLKTNAIITLIVVITLSISTLLY